MAADRQQPWLVLVHAKGSSTIHEFKQASFRLELPHSAPTVLTLMVGRRAKSLILQQLCSREDIISPDPHGWAFLRKDNLLPDSLVYVDFELHMHNAPSAREPGPEETSVTHETNWLDGLTEPLTRRRVGNLISGRAIGPLCHTICYFASDLGGLRGVAELLSALIVEQPATDTPYDCLPRAMVVVETSSRSFDEHATETALIAAISELAQAKDDANEEIDVHALLRRHFHSIVVVAVRQPSGIRERSRRIRKRLLALRDDWTCSRQAAGLLFRCDHTLAFTSQLLHHFCKDYRRKFSFIRSSRPVGLALKDFSYHLREVLALMPSEIWIWHFVCPLLASTIAFSNYPPGSHKFSIIEIYEQLYQAKCKAVLCETIVQQDTRDGFHRAIRKKLLKLEKQLSKCHGADVVSLHLCHLASLRPYFLHIKTWRTCLCCASSTPEKVLTCGHGLCDVCVRIVGKQSLEERYSFTLQACPLCGRDNELPPFKLMPPTAGVRLLSLDGGGVKGIILLVFLKAIHDAFAVFLVPLLDLFDFVCGTSAGGLGAIGLFLMQWPPEKGIEKFEELAKQTFSSQNAGTFTFAKVQQLALSYLRDWKYSSQPTEQAFRTEFGNEIKMFNPLSCDTRVAVTTTTVKTTKPCLITNYNGGVRDEQKGYEIIRAAEPQHDASLSQAASCTSAAPWFFKPKFISRLGTFQDGGLHHNNPQEIALWETRFLWPQKPLPDFALSIGTGYAKPFVHEMASRRIGPLSPVQERFFARLFKTFMKSLDGEKKWHDFYNGLPENTRSRFHRLNIPFEGHEPAIDDVAAMQALKRQVTEYISLRRPLTDVIDSLIASAFYYEFDECPLYDGDIWHCSGNIFCRLTMAWEARKRLYLELMNTSSYFLVFGRPVACVERLTKSAPPFKRRVTFGLRSLSEDVRITIRGITSKPMAISGLPRSAHDILLMQKLEAPFGRVDHNRSQKPLPLIPSKRRHSGSAV